MVKHEINHITPLLKNFGSFSTHSPRKRQYPMSACEALRSRLPLFSPPWRTRRSLASRGPSHCSLHAPGLHPAALPQLGPQLPAEVSHLPDTLSHPGTPSTPQDPLPQLSSSPELRNLRYYIFYRFIIVAPS